MKTRFLQAKSMGSWLALALLGNVGSVQAQNPATHYVSQWGTNPAPPYTNWATAATNIQDAVNVAVSGDSVIVTNGVYPGGVTVTNPLALISINGPQVTVINGGDTNQCVSLANGAFLTGFTLTNGNGFGVSCAASEVVSNCIIIGNSGGGATGGTLYNCTLSGNFGDGADSCMLYNCALTANSGLGADGGTNYNCTLTGNVGGGVSGVTLYNCIVYFNTAFGGANYDSACNLSYCCTTPLPPSGVGNIALDPQLASASHLSASSPCIWAGSVTYVSGTDIDGDAWNNPPSIGCAEYHNGTVTGPLMVAISVNYTNIASGFPLDLTAFIEGRTDLSVWDFGDGTVLSNRPYASHVWTATGDYPVTLRAYNDIYPDGVAVSVTIQVMAQPIYYVSLSSTSPVAPYGSWNTAATNIQDAVNAASVPGALVLVTNGVYAPITVNTPLSLQSLNGPDVTVIDGGGAGQCVYLSGDAVLVGFTLTNGFTYGNGGGAYCASSRAVLSNCVLTGNSAYSGGVGDFLSGSGGGAYGGTLNNCTLTGNVANSLFFLNYFGGSGGGAYGSTLNNCTLTGNVANVVIVDIAPRADSWIIVDGLGGGAYGGTLNNCTLTGNSGGDGGGAYGATLNNCTVTGNSGWGASSATLNNCIVYFNSDPNGGNYDSSSTLNYCCTTPMPTNGVGNISADPQLASASHLSAHSPCIRAGSAAYATGTDIDGEAWANPPSIGCDEYHAGTVTGPLSAAIAADYTTVAPSFPVNLTASIAGRTDLSIWDFGDGTVLSNRPYASHVWTAAGDYPVTLRAYNDVYPGGVAASVTVQVMAQPVYYVAVSSTSPVAPYGSWATAATNIQDAVDAVSVPGTLVLVTNGVYAPVTVNTPMTLQSVNGPDVTIIDGGGAAQCVCLTNNAVLVGFTLTHGYTDVSGGGAYCVSRSAVLSHCVLASNVAQGPTEVSPGPLGPGTGGGAYGGTLNNCTLTGNCASGGGGAYDCALNNCVVSGNANSGAVDSTLNNCTITGNSGWGVSSATLNNCLLYFNSDPNGGNYDSYSTLNYCCTTPMPTNGVGNITNLPLFVNYSNRNLRLQSNSPCINSGNNAYVVSSTDLDGNPRIVGGTVDIGAYEYQTPVSLISYAWLQQYGLPISTSIDISDLDGTGFNVYQDWIAGLNPTNALSVLTMLAPSATNSPLGLTVTWQSVSGITYFFQRSTNLAAQSAFTTIQSNIVGQAGTTSWTDTNAVGSGPFFYRVGVSQ